MESNFGFETEPGPFEGMNKLIAVGNVHVESEGGITSEILKNPKFLPKDCEVERLQKLISILPENQPPQTGDFVVYEFLTQFNITMAVEKHLNIEGDEDDSTSIRLALLEGGLHQRELEPNP